MFRWISAWRFAFVFSGDVFPQTRQRYFPLPSSAFLIMDSTVAFKSKRFLSVSSNSIKSMIRLDFSFCRRKIESFSFLHCPRCNHFIPMLLCVVVSQGVPRFKHFSTHNTGMAQVQMNLHMSFHSLLCIKDFGTH